MKSLTKAIAIASLATVATAAQAELSSTVGVVSDYVFRGAALGGAGAYASIDYEEAGFYVGAWTIDDGGTVDGLETDYYIGYGIELDGGIALDINYTRYEYSYDTGATAFDGGSVDITGQFEHEIGVSASMAGFSLGYVTGRGEAEADGTVDFEQDYDVITLAWANDTFGVTLAQVSKDDIDANGDTKLGEYEYNYLELSASKEISGFDFTATFGKVFGEEADDLSGGASFSAMDDSSKGHDYLVLDVSKSFDL